MFNINYLKFFVLISFVSMMTVPFYLGIHLTPAFRKLIIDNADYDHG